MKLFVFALCIVAAAALPADQPELKGFKSDVNALPESWNFNYEIKDVPNPEEHSRTEDGIVKAINDEHGATYKGSFSFVSPEGQKFTVDYVADENGFRPVGAHLPSK